MSFRFMVGEIQYLGYIVHTCSRQFEKFIFVTNFRVATFGQALHAYYVLTYYPASNWISV